MEKQPYDHAEAKMQEWLERLNNHPRDINPPTPGSIHVENATNVINGPVTITNQTTHNGH